MVAAERLGHQRRRTARFGRAFEPMLTFKKATILRAQSAVRCMPVLGRWLV